MTNPWIKNLHMMVNDSNDVIQWMQDGNGFIINSIKEFKKSDGILYKFYPRASGYSTFTRSLNYYNFCVENSDKKLIIKHKQNLFHRDNDNYTKITRSKSKTLLVKKRRKNNISEIDELQDIIKKQAETIAKLEKNIQEQNIQEQNIQEQNILEERKSDKKNNKLITSLIIGREKAHKWKLGMSKYPGITYNHKINSWLLQSKACKINFKQFSDLETCEKYYEEILIKNNINPSDFTRREYISPVIQDEEDVIVEECEDDEDDMTVEDTS
jgi:hypothetical protein